jgi:hypothetical protein
MPLQPDDDRRLRQTSGRLAGAGAPLLALGLVLYAACAILLLTGASTFLGLACLALGTPPTLAGVALLLSSGVSHRASQRKPFA